MEEKQYKGYLTPTLLNTFVSQYDIMPLLRRDEVETTEAMQNGLDFENRIIKGGVMSLFILIILLRDLLWKKMVMMKKFLILKNLF